MPSIFDRLFGRKTETSSAKAKERLQVLLIHDRINLSPEKMEQMKREILDVISKYVTVDIDAVDIALEQRERASKIVAEIPVEGNNILSEDDDDSDDDN